MENTDTYLGSTIDLSSTLNFTKTQPKNQFDQLEIKANAHLKFVLQNKFFKLWHKFVENDHIVKINELKLIRQIQIKKITFFFKIWESKNQKKQNLLQIGNNLRITILFSKWRKFMQKEFLMRKNTLKTLLAWQNIYQKHFFALWKMNRKYIVLFNNADVSSKKNLQRKVFTAFRVICSKKRNKEQKIHEVERNHAIFIESFFFNRWISQLHNQIIFNFIERRTLFYTCKNALNIWKGNFQKKQKKRKQIKILLYNSQKWKIQRCYNIWKNSFIQNNEIALKSMKVKEIDVKAKIKFCFYKWISIFNLSSFLTERKDEYLQIVSFRLKYSFFGLWQANYHSCSKKRERLEEGEKEMKLFKLNRNFSSWKTKLAESRYMKILYNRRSKQLNTYIIQRNFLKWKTKTLDILKDKSKIQLAIHFNHISLEIKVINSLQVYAESKKSFQLLLLKADKIYLIHLIATGLKKWRNHYISRRRKKVLIYSVLKIWAFNLKKDKFRSWKSWIEVKKEKKREESEALRCHRNRQVSLYLLSLIFGSQRFALQPSDVLHVEESEHFQNIIPIKADLDIEENLEDNDLLQSPFSTLNIFTKDSTDNLTQSDLDHCNGNFHYNFSKPIRPSFLGPPSFQVPNLTTNLEQLSKELDSLELIIKSSEGEMKEIAQKRIQEIILELKKFKDEDTSF